MKKFMTWRKANKEESIIRNSRYFDKKWYKEKYGLNNESFAAKHYLEKGWKIGYDPSPYFSTRKYLDINPDVREINPLLHYEKYGFQENRNIGTNSLSNICSSLYFDEDWYAKKYNITSKGSAIEHYLNIGWKLFYDPSPYFSTKGYLYTHPDVAVSGQNPLVHYELYGKYELPPRKIHMVSVIDVFLTPVSSTIKKSELFDEIWYRNIYQLDSKVEVSLHYLIIGSRLQFSPSKYFSELVYKKYYDLPLYECALLHFENYGKYYPCNTYQAIENLNDTVIKQGNYYNFLVDQKTIYELQSTASDKSFRPHSESVDIIICVYNAYEDVKKCIESVFHFTTPPYRIIIIDDNSAELTKNYLENIAANNTNVLLIRNTSNNHGYTYAANIGLRASTADYNILLNSDTIVSKNWVDNLIKCALARHADLVGPLSNTASWQSIPHLTDETGDWCHNELPADISIPQMAKMIEHTSECIYPEVPLLNGFCLMISRNAINILGYFDEQNFGRGFAEEDDYTSRANKAGLKLAIADDTYIFHAQSKSYTDEKRLQLCKISGERLREKHGKDYIEDCCKQMYSNFILDSIRYRTQMLFEQKTIIEKGSLKFSGLKILVLLPTSNASGGANVIIQEAIAMKKMGVEIQIMNLLQNREAFEESYHNIGIPTIYVQNFSVVKKYANKFDVICCTLYSTVKYCQFDRAVRAQIVYYIQDYEPYFFSHHGEEWKEAVDSYGLISNCIYITKTHWNAKEVYKNTQIKCNIIGPSVNLELFKPRKAQHGQKQISITAMLRPSTPRRGPEMTYRVLREIKKKYGAHVKINFFGCDATKEYESALFFNREQNDFEYTNYGFLSPEETSLLLSQTDIFVDFSTFQAMGLTAMEAMASGCATILTQYGGVTEFANHEENALLIDTLNHDTCFATLDSLINNPEICNTLSQNAYRDMCQFYPEKAAYSFLNTIITHTRFITNSAQKF